MEKDEITVVDPTLEVPKKEDENPTEDTTLAPTDDVIDPNTVVDDTTAPVIDAGVADTIDPLTVDATANKELDAPLADIVPPMADIPVDAPDIGPTDDDPTDLIDPVLNGDNANAGSCCDGGECCDNPNGANYEVTIGQYFGTLQESVTIAWRFHLKTRKHHVHIALHDFYDGALKIVDKIIEQYQGICGVIEEPYINCVIAEGKNESMYLTELKAFVENNKCVASCGHTEIESTIDEFLALIDETCYQILAFYEHEVKSFEEFCYEDLNESCSYEKRIKPFGDVEESCCGEEEEEEEE